MSEIKVIKKVDKDYLMDFIYKIDLNDKELYPILEDSPIGIFQFSGGTAEGVSKRVKPKTFEDMVAVNGFARPGTIDFLPQYLENRETGTSHYPDKINELLKDTHGTIIFQEQAMSIFNVIGGLSLEETNNLRGLMKKLGKADQDPKDLKEWDKAISKFEMGAIENGLTSIEAKKIAEDMLLMSSYSFNLSHSVAYSYNALITVYLTHYFKKYFYSTIIEYTMDRFRDSMPETLKKIREQGFEISPPNINKSKEKTFVDGNTIFLGLRNIKQVGDEVANSISSNAPYDSFFDFLVRNLDNQKINKRAIGSLVKFGAFDKIEKELNRKQMINAFLGFWDSKGSFSKALREEVRINKNLDKLIEENKEVARLYALWETSKNRWKQEEMLTVNMAFLKEMEAETLGFNYFISPFSDKEIEKFEEGRKKDLMKVSFKELNQENVSWRVPVFINKMRIIKDKNGNEMAFADIEDPTGDIVSIPIFASFWKYLKNKVFDKTICLMILYRNSNEQVMLGVNKYVTDENLISKFVTPIRSVYG